MNLKTITLCDTLREWWYQFSCLHIVSLGKELTLSNILDNISV